MLNRTVRTGAWLLLAGVLAACAAKTAEEPMANEPMMASGPPIMPGPGESVQCQNGAGPVFNDPDGSRSLYKWCPSTTAPGYAQRDFYSRSNSGGAWAFANNVLFNCDSQAGFIIGRIGLNGYAGVCP